MSNQYPQSILNKARKDKFLLVFNIPEILQNINASSDIKTNTLINQNSVQFSVFSSPIPTISIPSKPITFSGQTMNVTGYVRPKYAPINVRFTVDNNYHNWWLLWKWLDLINDSRKSVYNNDQLPDKMQPHRKISTYKTNMSIYGLDEFNVPTIEFKYLGVTIEALKGIDFSDRDPEEMESSFEFVIDQFDAQRVNIDTVPSAIREKLGFSYQLSFDFEYEN